jgi:hypothetical protein
MIERYAQVFTQWQKDTDDAALADPEWLAKTPEERGLRQAEYFAAELAKIPT